MRILFIYQLLFLFGINAFAQEVPHRGVPYLDVFMPEQYDNAGKIWDIQSNKQKILFLASDKGLLEFDGSKWKRYKGSKGFTRSLLVVNDSLIFTGSDLDFGKWEKNAFQDYEYTSLYPFKENAGRITEEFWGVYQIMDLVIFISFNNIYVYKNEQLTKISAPFRFSGSYFVRETLYLADEKAGVFSFDGVSLNLEFSYPKGKTMRVVGIEKNKEDLLVVTQNQGLYKFKDGIIEEWSKELSALLSEDQVFSFTTISNGYYVFGTILNGIYITDIKGKIVQHINKQRGLANNTILDLYYGPNGILWASMDLGLTGIQLSQNLAYVFDHAGDFGTGQTALIEKGTFYLGTNQGLYTSLWENFTYRVEGNSFNLVPESAGQVWDLEIVGKDLLCGHDKGLFLVSDEKLTRIKNQRGILDIVPIDDTHLLIGTYNGIHLYEKINDIWSYIHELNLIKGACSQIVIESKETLWVLIPNYGVIKANINDEFNIDSRTIFPVEKFKSEVLFLKKSEDGVQIFTENIKYFIDSSSEEMNQTTYAYSTEMVKHRLPGNHLPTTLNDSFQFFPIYNGFALKQHQNSPKSLIDDTLLLRSLEVFNIDTSLSFALLEEIPYKLNNLRIKCVIPFRENISYRYYLEGYMGKWSDWSNEPEVELLNLTEGNYSLIVEGRLDSDHVYSATFPVSIKAPWYRSLYSYLGYLSLFILLVYGLFKWQNYKLEKQKERLLYREKVSLRLQAEEYKKESIVKKQEELERENGVLEKELRSSKIQLVIKAKENEDRKRMINALSEKLRKMQGNEAGKSMQWKEIFRIMESHQEKENNTFQIHMDELNQAFTQQLKSNYPSLTMYDLRLCTYIKTGLSTREIAEMMHVLPSSINVSRSRLRKKLNLNAKDDLYSFLEGVQ